MKRRFRNLIYHCELQLEEDEFNSAISADFATRRRSENLSCQSNASDIQMCDGRKRANLAITSDGPNQSNRRRMFQSMESVEPRDPTLNETSLQYMFRFFVASTQIQLEKDESTEFCYKIGFPKNGTHSTIPRVNNSHLLHSACPATASTRAIFCRAQFSRRLAKLNLLT